MNHQDSLKSHLKRQKLQTLSLENIISTSDEDIDQQIMDCIENRLSEFNYDTGCLLKSLPSGAKALYLTWVVEGEVNNGGFNQFYWNGYGKHAHDALKAFEYFGALEHAEIVRLAIYTRSKEKTVISLLKLIGAVIGNIKAFSYSYKVSKLDPIDDLFYEVKENLGVLRLAKIRSSPTSFVFGN
jgi:Domain of unknown function (DUF4375)